MGRQPSRVEAAMLWGAIGLGFGLWIIVACVLGAWLL